MKNQQNHPKSGGSAQYVYTIGERRSRFPSFGIEKEFAQAVGRIKTDGMTDNEVMFKILSEPQNFYIANKLRCIYNSLHNIITLNIKLYEQTN